MKELASIEIKYLLDELKPEIENTKIEKISQHNEKEFSIQIYKRNHGKIILNITPNSIWLSKEKPSETIITNFLQQIKKHLEQGIIKTTEQIKNERIIKIRINNCNLIIELFGGGNIILTDEKNTIITALEKREWKTRKIFPREQYKTPESQNSILDNSLEELEKTIQESENNISQTLAVNGLGKLYAEEICIRANITPTEEKLNKKQAQKIYEKLQELKNSDKKPQIIYKDNKTIDITPIELEKYQKYTKKECKTFSEALETTIDKKDTILDKIEQKYKQKIEKLQKIIQKQEKELKEAEKQTHEEQQKAEKIYENYQKIKEAIDNKQKTANI